MVAVFALENPILRSFIGYAALVLVKTISLSLLTSYHRLTKRVFVNEEDTARFGNKVGLTPSHPVVERVRRCHLNDLENVIPFVLLGLLYVATGPAQWVATLHFRIFTISRFIHTFVYLSAVPQPARALTFFTGVAVNLSMAYRIISLATL